MLRTLLMTFPWLFAGAAAAAPPAVAAPPLDPELWALGLVALLAVRILAFAQLDQP
ncbi:MAG: hypothetical protein JRH01_01445 [Deltaproteobacteria bacterium]|nr:hypothetical protein [Deltaproteobacteria bacterium]MBW2394606.1 hypothetical protein [Deltaproteobacteria bacterium]